MSAMSVNATGQEVPLRRAEFGIGCSFPLTPKKYRPPRPMGVKGGCSPQNNLAKLAQLLAELERCCNKIFSELAGMIGYLQSPAGRFDSDHRFLLRRNFGGELAALRIYSLRSLVARVLILHAQCR